MPNCLSIFKNLRVEVERLLFLETSRWEDSEGRKASASFSSEKSIEHEGEIEYSEPSGHSDKLEKCLSHAKSPASAAEGSYCAAHLGKPSTRQHESGAFYLQWLICSLMSPPRNITDRIWESWSKPPHCPAARSGTLNNDILSGVQISREISEAVVDCRWASVSPDPGGGGG